MHVLCAGVICEMCGLRVYCGSLFFPCFLPLYRIPIVLPLNALTKVGSFNKL